MTAFARYFQLSARHYNFMYLVKSLRKDHRDSALNEGQVRIGTINYYREIEDAERVDGEEGLGKIVWCGQKLRQDHFNKIFTSFDGIQMINGWSIENKGIPIHGSYPNFNAFVYCYSEIENAGQIASTAGGKGDSFVCISNPTRFVASVREQLAPLILRDIRERAAPEEKAQILKTFDILDVNYRINYNNERKDRLVDESNIEEFDPMRFHPQDFFQKPTSYSYEREVRTVWLPVARHPITGDDVPLAISPQWRFQDVVVDPSVISHDLVECKIDLKTSTMKSLRV